MDWRFPGYFHPDTMPENAELMRQQGYGQIQELMSHYGQIDILWYDGGWLAHKGTDADAAWFWKPVELNTMVRKLQPKAVISPRSGWQGDFNVEEGDQSISGPVREKTWEKTFSLNRTAWGYTADNNTLPVARVVRLLVDAVVRNGNILINMSPDPDGVIPDAQVAVLKELGQWTHKYGQSIFGTRPGPYQSVDGSYGSTCIGKTVYLHVVGWPNKELVLPPQPFRVLRAKNLTGGKVAIQQSANGISISIAAEDRDPVDTIIQFDVDQAVTSLAP
jgi:alpha-L-fucosidase